jgi:DNA-binding transcriptional LysR family regulator
MHYDDIFLFVQLIEKGSFSRLSRHIGVNQSTISRRISQFEESLGKKLLQRNTRGLFELTADGADFYAKFSIISNDVNQYLNDFKQINEYAGVLRIAIPRVLFNYSIVPVIHQFQDNYPHIQLIVNYSGGEVDLIKDNLDMAIVVKQPINQNYKQKLLMSNKRYLYASNEYIAKYGAPTSLVDLVNHRMVGQAINQSITNELCALNEQTNEYTTISYTPKIITNNALFNLDFALNGGYIINAMDNLVINEVAAGQLVKLLPNFSFGETKFYLLRNNGLRNHLEAVFIDFLNSVLGLKVN